MALLSSRCGRSTWCTQRNQCALEGFDVESARARFDRDELGDDPEEDDEFEEEEEDEEEEE